VAPASMAKAEISASLLCTAALLARSTPAKTVPRRTIGKSSPPRPFVHLAETHDARQNAPHHAGCLMVFMRATHG
jgi:hypothetical protein